MFQVNMVFNPLWNDRESLRYVAHERTLAEAHGRLVKCKGLASFLAGQVIADLKYVKPQRDALDWETWACPGPGSRRGMNRVLNLPVHSRWDDSSWLGYLQILHEQLQPKLRAAKLPSMHAQDVQNCLCEFDKYERVRLGEGTPRRKYPGTGRNESPGHDA